MTRVIARSIGGGKTHAAVEWVKEDPGVRVMVVASHDAKVWVRRRFGLGKDQVFTVGEVSGGRLRGLGKRGLVVDNADMVLSELLGHFVEAVTVTGVYAWSAAEGGYDGMGIAPCNEETLRRIRAGLPRPPEIQPRGEDGTDGGFGTAAQGGNTRLAALTNALEAVMPKPPKALRWVCEGLPPVEAMYCRPRSDIRVKVARVDRPTTVISAFGQQDAEPGEYLVEDPKTGLVWACSAGLFKAVFAREKDRG